MGEFPEPQLADPELVRNKPKIIGIIGPHAIGKDSVIENLQKELPGDVRVFSVGKYISENLIDQPSKVVQKFTKRLVDSGVQSRNTQSNVIKGKELVAETEYNYKNHLPIPQEVADWLLKDFLRDCTPDTIVLMSGGPYSDIDLQLMETHTLPSGLILLSPTSQKWWDEIPRREKERKGEDFVDEKYDVFEEWNKWKDRAAKVLKHAHRKNYPILHVSLRNPKLNKKQVNDKVSEGLTNFITSVKKGVKPRHLQNIDVQ